MSTSREKDMKSWQESLWSKVTSWEPGDEHRSTTRPITVTPDMARDYLSRELYTKGTSKADLTRYTSEMLSGNFVATNDSITFNEHGRGVNGHTRCMACIAANRPFQTFVQFGSKQEYGPKIDRGHKRTMSQSLGAPKERKEDSSEVSTVTRMIQVNGLKKSVSVLPCHRQIGLISTDLVDKVRTECEDALVFTMGHFSSHKPKLSSASVKAAVVKAFHHTRKYPGGRERLGEFCTILQTGRYEDLSKDSAAYVLREHLLNGTVKSATHDQGLPLFRKTAYCINKFMRGENIERVANWSIDDPFPMDIPDAQTAEGYQDLMQRVNRTIENTQVAQPVNARK